MSIKQAVFRCFFCAIGFTTLVFDFAVAQTELKRIVADDLNGTWNVEKVSGLFYNSNAKRVSTIADFERLSIWVVFESDGKQDALEFIVSDVTDSMISFELSRERSPFEGQTFTSSEYEKVRKQIEAVHRELDRTIDHEANSSTLAFDLRERSFSLEINSARAARFKKFLGSVPVQAIGVAAQRRRQKMMAAGIVPTPFDSTSNVWLNEFLLALEPLANGVLEEYGRKLGAGRNPSARESGMAAAAALLKLSAKD
ncbi:MAG: hypothetical protein AAGJ46_13915 [Planctomycetota bacterium]